jgi:prepilin-type N-terminal cleavage/methylation domain-containing protein/prepilin-type processing-associated H-X9-DG protein
VVRRAARRGFTLIEVLVAIAILVVLVGLLLPAVQKAREAAARTRCQNNLKQIGIALHAFHDVRGGFPAAKQDGPNVPSHSWTPFVLPYLELAAVADQYRFDHDWNDPATNDADPGGPNQAELVVFICPSAPAARRGNRGRGVLDYPAINQVVRPNRYLTVQPHADPTFVGVLGYNVRRRMDQIKDGASNTLLVAESAGRTQAWQMGFQCAGIGTNGGWANPSTEIKVGGFDPANPLSPIGPCGVNCTNNNEVYGFHPAGANVVFADGSVRILRARMDVNLVVALTTRCGGETIHPDL